MKVSDICLHHIYCGATARAGGGTRAQVYQRAHENHKAGGAREEISRHMKRTRRRLKIGVYYIDSYSEK